MSVIQFKEANCKNCYKCIRSCPVKAISFKDEQARIMEDACMLCGNCLVVCPQNAKSVKSDIQKVKKFIEKGDKVYVSLAPSFVSAFNVEEEGQVLFMLKQLGFTHIEETAIGAAEVSRQYERLMREKKMKNIIATACPAIVSLVQKYYPELIDQLAPVVSPMIAHARMMRSIYGPRIRVVFIGPCIAKKEECKDLQNEGAVDAVITFEELEQWMQMESVTFSKEKEEPVKGLKNNTSRFYPAPGGIIKTLGAEERKQYKCVTVDGVDRSMEILESMRQGYIQGYFIEMNSCAGGCLGGPCMRKIPGGYLEARERLISYVKRNARENVPNLYENAKVSLSKVFIDTSKQYTIPDEETIRSILSRIGKFSADKELNCGACGYTSCREKAIAVYNNKAELHMCLPYMRERAESLSNIMIHTTPNAIFALDANLCIQDLNYSAQMMFRLEDKDVKGKCIHEVLDCPDFSLVKETAQSIFNKKYRYEDYGITVEQSIVYNEQHDIIIAVMKNITREEKQQEQIYKVRSETVDIAQKVIEKQMRVAQEIASLLGETTAETKIALTKLKNSILTEIGEGK